MLTGLASLALEVKSLDRTRAFYVDRLGLRPVRDDDSELVFDIGGAALVFRRPTGVPRGGLHTHYAFSTSKAAYGDWHDRLASFDPAEHQFGSYRSLYVDDPDDHCVEIGDNADDAGDGLSRIFEIVLEVTDLDAAEARYTALGFEVVDRGEARRRVRLAGPFDLELWEPQLGLADARGGVHVDLGFAVEDADTAVDAIESDVCETLPVENGRRVREADGHVLTFVEE